MGRNEPCWCGSGKKLKKCHVEPKLEVLAIPQADGSVKHHVVELRMVRPSDIEPTPCTPEWKHVTCDFYGHTNPLDCLVRCVECDKLYDGCLVHDTKMCSVECATVDFLRRNPQYRNRKKEHGVTKSEAMR